MKIEILRFILVSFAAFELITVGRCLAFKKYLSAIICFILACFYTALAVYG